MRGQNRWISCDHNFEGLMCDEQFEQDGFIAPRGEVTWSVLESAAREEGWSFTRWEHLCPHHSPEEPFG